MNGASYALVDVVAKISRSPTPMVFDELCSEKSAETLVSQITRLCKSLAAADGGDEAETAESTSKRRTIEMASIMECFTVTLSLLHHFANEQSATLRLEREPTAPLDDEPPPPPPPPPPPSSCM